MSEYDVSIVVSPRERFTSIVASLKSLFSSIPASVPVYVIDGCCPKSVAAELEDLQAKRPFHYISKDYYLTPQEARNMGFEKVKTSYVVFSDNDIHYEHGWLEAMLLNAKSNNSDLVAPLICIGPPKAKTVHHAGGRLAIHIDETGHPHVTERHQLIDKPLGIAQESELPLQTDIVEFHCFLAKSAYIKRAGPLDERLITREQIDFGLRAKLLKANVTFEKQAVVTYMATESYLEIDLPYLAFRWSDALALRSIETFKNTWGIETNGEATLNKWIRPHRARAFASCFKSEYTKQGKEFFLKTVVPLERKFNDYASSTRKGLSTNHPAELDPQIVKTFFDKFRKDPHLNVAWVPPFLQRNRPLVVAGMATMPSRRETFFEALESILPQVDRLYLFLDRFKTPLQIQHEKIIPLHSAEFGDLRANGKFLGLTMCGIGPDYFSVDDDIVYPPDYVARMVSRLRDYHNTVALGVHGNVILRAGFDRYLNSRKILHRSKALQRDIGVDVLGTDTTMFSTKRLSFDVRKIPVTNMVDLSFAHICEKAGVPRLAISRKESWIQCLEENQPDSIYRMLKHDDSVQTRLARDLISVTEKNSRDKANIGIINELLALN